MGKLVPKLSPTEECVDVPKEVCTRSRTNPRKVKKPVVKKWCYVPTEESGLAWGMGRAADSRHGSKFLRFIEGNAKQPDPHIFLASFLDVGLVFAPFFPLLPVTLAVQLFVASYAYEWLWVYRTNNDDTIPLEFGVFEKNGELRSQMNITLATSAAFTILFFYLKS